MTKRRCEMSIDELIVDAGWFPGTDADWKRLSLAERSELSFAATGCLIAYATWPSPVECYHSKCLVARGEKPPEFITDVILANECERGWLRFLSAERQAATCKRIREECHKTGIYDPWELPGGWQVMVNSAL